MQKEVTKWANVARKATKNRDDEIRRMHQQGDSFRTIARDAGLSIGAIQKIVKKGKT